MDLSLTSNLPYWLSLPVLVWVVMMAVYHAAGLLFEWADLTKVLAPFKVRHADKLSYAALLPRVLFNQTCVLLPAMIVFQWLGLAFTGAPHIGLWHFVAALVLMGVGHDVVQYFSHRYLLHSPRLFRKLGHSLHHSTGASRAISACYMTAADFFLEIVLPYLVPLVLVAAGTDVPFHLTAASLGALGGLYEHSGYDFAVRLRQEEKPGARYRLLAFFGQLITSKAHGEHHRRGNVSFSDGFGSPGICDTFFKTRWDLAGAEARGPASRLRAR
jgi:sterol desaturase/sphingolipid hydroxylase (fatty acid hydroxylase superfamily)